MKLRRKFINLSLTILTLFTLTNFSYSQKIKLNDLKFIYEHDIETVDDYLLKKGFDFYSRQKGEDSPMSTYKDVNSTYISKTSDESYSGLTMYQFYDSKIYTSIREECKKLGFKLIRTDTDPIEGLGLNYIYSDGKRRLKFSSRNKLNFSTYYIFYGRVYESEL
jgi:hypothetical protein